VGDWANINQLSLLVPAGGGGGYLSPESSAVALATRNTMAGRSFLPPAPNICSAAASSRGLRLPTMLRRFSAICSMSSLTGARIWLDDIVGELCTQSPPAGAAGLSAGLRLPFWESAVRTLGTCGVRRLGNLRKWDTYNLIEALWWHVTFLGMQWGFYNHTSML